MNVPCQTNYTYLSSPNFVVFSLHCITSISIPIHILGFYCIFYKTPTQMSSVKRLLLVLHVCCVTLDIMLTLIAIPYPMFPAMAGYGLGLVDSPGLLFYLIVTIITANSTSVFVIIENRFFVLFAERTWWRHVRKYVIALSYVMVPIYFFPSQFYIPEQIIARETVWKSLECQPELPEHRELFVLSTDFLVPGYSILVAEGVPTIEIGSFAILMICMLCYRTPKNIVSRKTMELQKKLAWAIIIQCFAILVLFAVPINTVVYVIYYWYQSQAINNLVFFGLSIHGTASTLIMIFIHTPYRNFVLSPLRRLLSLEVPTISVRTRNSMSTNVLDVRS